MTDRNSKMKPAIKALWLQALRSGKYEQGQGYLHTNKGGEHQYCCLGVLCEIAVELDPTLLPVWRDVREVSYGGQTQFLPITISEWAGLEGDSPEIFEPVEPYEDYDDEYISHALADLNDNGNDFAFIANMIERYL